ncbi:hypothetical protein [Acinetobacter sp.]|uniref:hypothetical protein n=1 Tax=Acinetobacter sp. TaxID=472 RepID=UPI00388DDE6A
MPKLTSRKPEPEATMTIEAIAIMISNSIAFYDVDDSLLIAKGVLYALESCQKINASSFSYNRRLDKFELNVIFHEGGAIRGCFVLVQ